MAEHSKTSTDDLPADDDVQLAWWKTPAMVRWIAAAVVVSIVFQVGLFVLVRKSTSAALPMPTEHTVGTFAFYGIAEGSRSVPAKFNLHIRFVDDLDSAARIQLAAHQFRVREVVEGVLRQSHGLEFTDQALSRFKHEVQERIDDAIDLRAVAEVILTDFAVDPLPAQSHSSPSVAMPTAGMQQTSTTPVAPAAEDSATITGY